MYRQRFGLTAHPLPKDAHGKTFFDKSPGYPRLERAFAQLIEDRGVGLLTGAPGVGKTSAIRNLCQRLPAPDHRVIYLADTQVSPLELYRTLAQDLGLKPAHRRGQLWADIKKTLIDLVDNRGTLPVVILDEAQHLSDRFLSDLCGFLNFAFDSRELFALWLVGLPAIARQLRLQPHAALAMRIAVHVHLDALSREAFTAAIEHAIKAAGSSSRLLGDEAMEMLFRASRGTPRLASRLLRAALRRAHEHDQSFVDEHRMQEAVDELALTQSTLRS
ncbi:MAG: ExeA family protein [Terriglobales bacterium]